MALAAVLYLLFCVPGGYGMSPEIDLSSPRAKKARLSKVFGKGLQAALFWIGLALIGGAIYGLFFSEDELARLGYFALSTASLLLTFYLWAHYDLRRNPVLKMPKQLVDLVEPTLLGRLKPGLTPQTAWDIALASPEARFLTNHLLMSQALIRGGLSNREEDMHVVWDQAERLIDHQLPELHSGTLAVALIATSPDAMSFLTARKLSADDLVEVLSWVDRRITYMRQPKPYFGGIGRDWAAGFTPTLEHFGQNMSRTVEMSGGFAHYYAHSDLLDGIVNSLERDTGVALIGPDGAGKTTLVYGLAQRLLEGRDPHLKYYQIVSLNASLILSYSDNQLEALMLNLFGEGIAAGNIILFLDDAELFFTQGVGSFDMSQILMPVLKNHNIKIIAAFNPIDWQHLQASRQALTNSFTALNITEPDTAATMMIAEDSALMLESHNRTLISYEAVREAYRLSGQFMQEQAYPGKVVHLLEQALPYAQDGVMAAETIQAAVEKTKGVKVSAAAEPEAEMLLNLEDRIHERMINQKRAVNVVAAALRRGRAGVSNPKRPVGSFLFLGPTGVGKTELARSLAAVYFGDEHQMIRLDMSEYQRPEDVSRLLAGGGSDNLSLLLAIRQQPFAVVLLDEIEKAHPNILNLLLQMLDEGQLTDEQGRPASFRSSIIIATSNAGAADIAGRVREGGMLDDFERPLIDKLISQGQFKPELVNRFDEVVLFRPLNEEELAQVANVMLREVNRTLANQQVQVQLTPEALKQIVHQGYDPEFGARPMRRIIQKTVENAVAIKLLRREAGPGSVITLDVGDLGADPAAGVAGSSASAGQVQQ
jgi:ATP-dependent Clp protease ATP-binding subunit ClpC